MKIRKGFCREWKSRRRYGKVWRLNTSETYFCVFFFMIFNLILLNGLNTINGDNKGKLHIWSLLFILCFNVVPKLLLC